MCVSDRREEIDKAILEGKPYRAIEREFGFNIATISRHKAKHLAREAARRKAGPVKIDQATAGMIVDQVLELKGRAMRILDNAEASGSNSVAINAIKEVRGILELLARITGELKTGINITIAPEWITLRTLILQAVEPFPAAAQAIVKAIEAGGGADPQLPPPGGPQVGEQGATMGGDRAQG